MAEKLLTSIKRNHHEERLHHHVREVGQTARRRCPSRGPHGERSDVRSPEGLLAHGALRTELGLAEEHRFPPKQSIPHR